MIRLIILFSIISFIFGYLYSEHKYHHDNLVSNEVTHIEQVLNLLPMKGISR